MPNFTRRDLNRSLMIAGVGSLLPRLAAAQDATPEAPALTFEAITSDKRDDWTAAYKAKMNLSAPEGPGGTYIDAGVSDIQSLQPFL
ncbi:MAG: hypothetical protein ACR2J8_08995, partial [Thermomicrobiales bacterium]